MIRHVLFLSLNKVAVYKPTRGDRIISIMGHGGEPADLNPSWSEQHILRMNFDDVTHVQEGCFTEDHARTIIAWVDKMMEDRDANRLIVHCIGGRSRSVAVAEFVAARCALSFDYLGFQPNSMVRDVLISVMQEMP